MGRHSQPTRYSYFEKSKKERAALKEREEQELRLMDILLNVAPIIVLGSLRIPSHGKHDHPGFSPTELRNARKKGGNKGHNGHFTNHAAKMDCKEGLASYMNGFY